MPPLDPPSPASPIFNIVNKGKGKACECEAPSPALEAGPPRLLLVNTHDLESEFEPLSLPPPLEPIYVYRAAPIEGTRVGKAPAQAEAAAEKEDSEEEVVFASDSEAKESDDHMSICTLTPPELRKYRKELFEEYRLKARKASASASGSNSLPNAAAGSSTLPPTRPASPATDPPSQESSYASCSSLTPSEYDLLIAHMTELEHAVSVHREISRSAARLAVQLNPKVLE